MWAQTFFIAMISLAIFFQVWSASTQNPLVWQIVATTFLVWAFVAYIGIAAYVKNQ